jgi:hypothetical protein
VFCQHPLRKLLVPGAILKVLVVLPYEFQGVGGDDHCPLVGSPGAKKHHKVQQMLSLSIA